MTTASKQPTIIHNTDSNRFETTINVAGTDYTGYISYQLAGDTLIYDHTIVPKELGGRGVASALVKQALDYAEAEGKQVVPQCWFVEKYINKHPEYKFLLL